MGQVCVRDPHRFGFGVVGAHKIASYIDYMLGVVYLATAQGLPQVVDDCPF
ncbi:hypothetical protein OX462_14060 [Janthinobacterium sp. SUN098]|uniref:hypothetical protein n=1 Tax=Janthinobacterium sp. SUN098 TaxID=3002437 RepID=UPI0038D4652E